MFVKYLRKLEAVLLIGAKKFVGKLVGIFCIYVPCFREIVRVI